MKTKARRSKGAILIPKESKVHGHELKVAAILVTTGDDVQFLRPRATPTPDILFQGVEWEIKSPMGSSSRTIENNLRLALKQSNNVILDLQRIRLSEKKCLSEVNKKAKKLNAFRRLWVIDKSGKLRYVVNK